MSSDRCQYEGEEEGNGNTRLGSSNPGLESVDDALQTCILMRCSLNHLKPTDVQISMLTRCLDEGPEPETHIELQHPARRYTYHGQ